MSKYHELQVKQIMIVPEEEAEDYESGMVHSDLTITRDQIQRLLDGDVLAISVDEMTAFVRIKD